MKPLQRMALKDIKNDPMLGSGLHSPAAPWKERLDVAEGGGALQKPKARKGSVRFEDGVHPSGAGRHVTTDNQTANKLLRSPKLVPASRTSFFSNPTEYAEKEGLECAGTPPLTLANKYFNTPVVSKGRAKKALSPVMEVDMDSAEDKRQQEATAASRTPQDVPFFRDSFAAECQEIVKQIKGLEDDSRRSPNKRKAEELEVSCIDAEPPPYECTPMKSFLAWEVSNMLSSLESSAVNDSASVFGESLLDLERSDMQLHNFTFSDLKTSEGPSVEDSAAGGRYYSTDCIKRQKIAPPPFDIPDILHCEPKCCATTQNLTPPSERIIQAETCGMPNLTMELTNNGPDTLDVECIASQCPEQEEVNKPSANTTVDLDELVNTTHDIELAHQPCAMLNTTEVIEVSPRTFFDLTQEIAVVSKEVGKANMTIEIKDVSDVSTNGIGVPDERDIGNTTVNRTSPIAKVTADISHPAETMMKAGDGHTEDVGNTTVNITSPIAGVTTEILVKAGDGHTEDVGNLTMNRTSPNTEITSDIMMKASDGHTEDIGNATMNITLPIAEVTTEILVKAGDGHREDIGNTTINRTSSIAEITTDLMMKASDGHTEGVGNPTMNRTLPIAEVTTEILVKAGDGHRDDVGNPTMNRTLPIAEITADIMMKAGDGDTEDNGFVHDGTIDKTPCSPSGTFSTITSAQRGGIMSPNGACDVVTKNRNSPENISSSSPFPKVDAIHVTYVEEPMPACHMTCAEDPMLTCNVPQVDSPMPTCNVPKDNSVPTCDVLQAKSPVPTCDVPQAKSPIHTCDVPQAKSLISTNDVPHLENPGPVCDVPQAEDTMPFCDVPKAENPRSLCDVPQAEDPMPTCNVPEEHPMPMCDVPQVENTRHLCDVPHAEDPLPASNLPQGEDPLQLCRMPHGDNPVPTCDMPCAEEKMAVCDVPSSQDDASNKEGNDVKDCSFASPSVSPAKELKGHLLASESFSMIQEEENVHDVSVFSAASLSFVTSTPVPGLINFQFQKACKDSEQQDLNTSVGFVEPPQTKEPTEGGTTALAKPLGAALGLKPQSKGIPRPPTSAIPAPSSGIPGVRRSLAMLNNPKGQNLAKDPPLSKMPPKGIPVKGAIKPPLAWQSLSRPSMGNVKQNLEGRVAVMPPSKLNGSTFKTPKVATAKATKIQAEGSISKPTPVQTTPSTGVKSFLPKPGGSALHPPLPASSQKSFLKQKSNLPGLPGRSQLPALGSQKKSAPVRAEGQPIRRQIKAPSSHAAPAKDAPPKVTPKSNLPATRTQPMKAEPSGETPTPPIPLPETSQSECCRHVEACPTCQVCESFQKLLQNLLQENEDLRRQLARVQHGKDG